MKLKQNKFNVDIEVVRFCQELSLKGVILKCTILEYTNLVFRGELTTKLTTTYYLLSRLHLFTYPLIFHFYRIGQS